MVRLGTEQPTSFSGMLNEMKIIEWFFFPYTFLGFIGSCPSYDSFIYTNACMCVSVKYNTYAYVWENSASSRVPFSILSLLYADHLRRSVNYRKNGGNLKVSFHLKTRYYNSAILTNDKTNFTYFRISVFRSIVYNSYSCADSSK